MIVRRTELLRVWIPARGHARMTRGSDNENTIPKLQALRTCHARRVCATGVGAAAPIDFKAGIADPVNTVLAWYMARDAGFYAAQGLNVQIINMNGGSKGAEELQAGRIDVMHVGLSSVIRINRSGGDIRLVGSLSNVIRFTFFSAPGVKTADDLKGGVVGVSTFGSESDSTVTLALQRLGLDARRHRAQGIRRRHAPARRRRSPARSRRPRSTSRSRAWRAPTASTCWSIW